MSDPTVIPQPAGNVLIVEDDPDVRAMLSAFLVTEGFHPVAAEDGLEALHLLRIVRHRAPDVPCLILLDLMMPRLSGGEFRRAQLGDPTVSGVPVAVMSGASDVEQRAQALGAVATLAKPIDCEMLIQVLRRYCASPATADGSARIESAGLPAHGLPEG
jgi:CheY-like chemotaxis protein